MDNRKPEWKPVPDIDNVSWSVGYEKDAAMISIKVRPKVIVGLVKPGSKFPLYMIKSLVKGKEDGQVVFQMYKVDRPMIVLVRNAGTNTYKAYSLRPRMDAGAVRGVAVQRFYDGAIPAAIKHGITLPDKLTGIDEADMKTTADLLPKTIEELEKVAEGTANIPVLVYKPRPEAKPAAPAPEPAPANQPASEAKPSEVSAEKSEPAPETQPEPAPKKKGGKKTK